MVELGAKFFAFVFQFLFEYAVKLEAYLCFDSSKIDMGENSKSHIDRVYVKSFGII
jgi:hypothetical protein